MNNHKYCYPTEHVGHSDIISCMHIHGIKMHLFIKCEESKGNGVDTMDN